MNIVALEGMPVDETPCLRVLHSVQEGGPAVGVLSVQALLGGQLQHAQAKGEDVDAARVLSFQVVLRQHSCTAASKPQIRFPDAVMYISSWMLLPQE